MDRQENLVVVDEAAQSDGRVKILIPIAVLSLIALLGIYAMSSASDHDPTPGPVGPNPWGVEWQKKSDGSLFSSTYEMPGDRAERFDEGNGATRCWPSDSGYQCLHVINTGGIGRIRHVSTTIETELPEVLLPFTNTDGYSCSTVMGTPQETISNGSATLTSNQLRSLDDRWSRKFVTKFMADNNVEGQWFDCLTVLREVSSGSLETLGTTLITRSVLPQG
jgi:hypothetical protein